MRAVEQKGRDDNVKTLAVFGPHRVGPTHHTGWSRQRRAGCIAKGLTGFNHWRFANNARSANFLDLSTAVGDLPEPICDGEVTAALIVDFDRIGPNKSRVARIGLFGQEFRRDADNNVLRPLFILWNYDVNRHISLPLMLSLPHAPLRSAPFKIRCYEQIPVSLN